MSPPFMKSLRPSSRAAFTLIELLVVISIIAVLASLAIPTANVVMRKAKEAQARATVAGVIAGIKNYQTEYNRLPDPSMGSSGTGGRSTDAALEQGTSTSDNLMPILHPDPTASPPPTNPRRIDFYDGNPVNSAGGNGLVTTSTPNSLVDPWASTAHPQPYFFALDYGGDNAIDQNLDPTMKAQQNLPGSVIGWSTGQPLNPGTPNTGTDPTAAKYFVCSWK